jgi:hypothetical protein
VTVAETSSASVTSCIAGSLTLAAAAETYLNGDLIVGPLLKYA